MLELLKDLDGFVGPALLIIIGGVFKVWQTQIQDRRRAREALAKKEADDKEKADDLAREQREREREQLQREADAKREAQRVAREAQLAAEKTAREEREKLERELEREREDRRREADLQRKILEDTVHHLKGKMQTYENLEGIHKKQIQVLEDHATLLQERLDDADKTISRLRERLQKYEPLGDK